MYGVYLILVLVITGGIIAYIGDRMGMKIGKKRLSLFGLRPRYTSTLITVFSGICITTVTFGIMAAVSSDVRTALFGMEKLNREMAATQASLLQAESDNEAARQKLQSFTVQIKDLQQEHLGLKEESQRLKDGNHLLEIRTNELTSRNEELIYFNDSLTGENSRLQGDNTALTSANDELTQSNSELSKQKSDLEKQTEALRQGIISIREGDIVFRAGEIIAQGIVDGSGSENGVQDALNSLAMVANRNVAERLGTSTPDDGIWIYPLEYEEAVKTILANKQKTVVRIVAIANLIRGEAVRCSFELYKDNLIYSKGDLVLSAVCEVNGSRQEAEAAAMGFLGKVNEVAVAKGVLPDPIQGSVGAMEGSQFYAILDKLTATSGRVSLAAYATEDTDSMGPLRITVVAIPLPDQLTGK